MSEENRGWLTGRAVEMRRNHVDAEAIMWGELRRRQLGGYKFRRQHVIGRAIVDFYCAETRLALEIDGPTHNESKDARRDLLLARSGIEVVRVANTQVYEHLPEVLDMLLGRLYASASYPETQRRTRVARR